MQTCESLLRKIHRSLAPGGRVITLEFVPHDDRVTPPPVAEFSRSVLATTPEGDAYTFREYERMFAAAGFTRTWSCTRGRVDQQVLGASMS
ncbi:MAG: hypothetical protein MRJ92_06610 [Nitrospira sp.]|nr:hypothetical protein [Nitrospira sp.]